MTLAVIFDIDGTLVDSVDLHADAWVKALRHFDIEVPFDAVRHEIGKGGDQLLPVFVPAERLRQEEETISSYRGDLFKREYMADVQAFPDVPELFRRARAAGLTVALASSAKADEVERYSAIAGITDLVDVTVSADDAERSKPTPDIFVAALRKLAPIPPTECIVVGDTPWDILAAKRAGLSCIGVLCGGFPEAELRDAGAIAIFRDPADLLARFDESPLAQG